MNTVKWSSFICVEEDLIMAPNLLFDQLLVVALVFLCLLIHVWWPDKVLPMPQPPLTPTSPNANAPKNPSPFPGSSTNRSARHVSREPMPLPRRPAHPLRSLPSPEDAGAPSTPARISVRLPIAPIMAGSVAATSAPMAIPAAIPGASYNVFRVMDISTRRTARSFMASAPRRSSSCG